MIVIGRASAMMADIGRADSVIAFSNEDLIAVGAQDISDLATFTPNLEIVTQGGSTPTFFIRGVGLNDFNPNSTGAVAIYQDGVAINSPALQLGTLFDVETVNVLRGPQGTGLARNASAGAIKVYSKKPTGGLGAYMIADFGNFDAQDYQGVLETPLVEGLLSMRAAFRISLRDGTMKNRCAGAPAFGDRVPHQPGQSRTIRPWSICGEAVPVGEISEVPTGLADHVNDQDNWAARVTMLFEPTIDMNWLLNAHGSRRDELTTLGQSIGTSGNFCVDGEICSAPFGNVPPELLGRPSKGWLGAAQGSGRDPTTGYQSREIRARLEELAPCLVAENFQDSCALQPLDVRVDANRAKITLSKELARDLDSEPWKGDFNRTGQTTNDTWGLYLKGDIDLPTEIKLKTTSAYDRYRRRIDRDLDFSPETLFQILTQDDSWQFYQDVKFEGELGDDLALTWEIGGWFLREELDVDVQNDFGNTAASGVAVSNREYHQDTSSAGGYAYLSFDFLDDFTLDGGYRYNWEQKDFTMDVESGSGVNPRFFELDETWDSSTGTIRLTYRFREDTHVYWKYTRGWKPGSINATASQFSGPTVAAPETIDSFEAGMRGAWFDGLIALDAQLFFYSYSDYQIFTAQQFLGGNPEFVILNAEDAEVFGAEVEATTRPWEGGLGIVRFGWLETQFLDFVRRDQFLRSTPGGGSPVNFREAQNAGNSLLNSPRFKVSMVAEQAVPLGRFGSLTLRYDGVWTDQTFYDATGGSGLGNEDGKAFLPDDTIAQKAFWLHNLRATWRPDDRGQFELSGWVRNIENESYKTFAFDASSFQNTTIYFVGDPRTYGVSMRVSF